MLKPKKLSLEQEFNIRAFATKVQQMNLEQAQDFLVKLYQHMIAQEQIYKELIGQK
ncbi:NblA/ycf18 family protein [Mastigocoleus sp. MO_188.B34]|uniref:NblA/ycf18 family protein n=1 Tax=Mastigocoleus sp. MO_188.B34 TaxID=3036635 RepID=UPI002610E4AA|nr:NblA/ycf18 family protein [Mastigocoleus sp. MO_188.B34]MDJ0694135.1 NblA/ycf18 family protein [Mastigocoleus sp. MO_188.B34]